MRKRVLLLGNEACCQGALKAGCDFYAGYPITPSTEIMEFMAREMPKRGRKFIQMEDEIASMASVIGASWAGARAMTATSGPGFTLMMENIGYAAMTETPCVVVDIQRAGPSTGQATRVGSGDVYQARFGSHGDYDVVALAPWSVQEMYDLTIHAFNIAEEVRSPVFVMADEAVGHLREKVMIHNDIPLVRRVGRSGKPPFGDPDTNKTSPMPTLGRGKNLLVTGSTHDHMGLRQTSSPQAHHLLVDRLAWKIRERRDELERIETYHCEDAKIFLVAYGFTARSALAAVRKMRNEMKVPVGLVRLVNLWPFPINGIKHLLTKARHVIVPEMNQGLMAREIERAIMREVWMIPKTNGSPFKPEELIEAVGGVTS